MKRRSTRLSSRQFIEQAKKHGLIDRVEIITIPETEESRETWETVRKYLQKLDKFEAASRKVNFRVGGNGCYCQSAIYSPLY